MAASFVQISWNGVPVAAGRISQPVKKTLNTIEKQIKAGIRAGARDTINDGKTIAKGVIKSADAMGRKKALFNSIRSELKSQINFYLIAGYGTSPRQMYPLYIEKGFKQHFRPMNPQFEAWLRYKAHPEVLKIAMERGGLIVGRNPKWRSGIRFMETAYKSMQGGIKNKVAVNIIKKLRGIKFKG